MGDCCQNKEEELAGLVSKHKSVLWIVLIINLVMFFVELGFGWVANSLALIGDSLDMLGDAVTYGSSLVVVGMGTAQKNRVAKLKAWIMLLFGASISARAIYRGFYPETPEFKIMFAVGGLALAMNLICLALLTKHRDDDINMRSVWICSRNDIVANSAVLLAALLVMWTGTYWADIAVGIGLVFLFTKSALGIFRDTK